MSIFARIVVILLVSCKGGRCCVSSTTARCQVVVGDIPLAELAEYTVSYTHYALQHGVRSVSELKTAWSNSVFVSLVPDFVLV